MIMGVGLVSLATLFPLGLMRLRAAADVSLGLPDRVGRGRRGDAQPPGRRRSSPRAHYGISLWYLTAGDVFDPWIQDTPSAGQRLHAMSGSIADGEDSAASPSFVRRRHPRTTRSWPGPGLPVADDPLWRDQHRHPFRHDAGAIGIRRLPSSGSPAGIAADHQFQPLRTSSSDPRAHGLYAHQLYNTLLAEGGEHLRLAR